MSEKINRDVVLNIPNILSYGRIATVPVILVLMLLQTYDYSLETKKILSLSAAFLFIAASISDLIDGHYARKYGMVSVLGKFLDPVADKVLHMTAMIMLVPLGQFPAWLAVVLLFREMFINGLRSVAASQGVIIDAGKLGKRKTAFYSVGLSAILLHDPIFGISVYTVGWVSMVIGAVFSIVSGIEYTGYFFKKVMGEK